MSKKYLILLVVAVLFQSSVLKSEAETIRMGCFELRPHMYTSEKTGAAKGAAIAYFEKIAKKMGYDVEWIGPLPHSRMLDYLERGELIDGDPLISRTSAREKFLFYADNHFYLAKPNFIVRQDNPLDKINSADDVKGFVIGQFKGANHSKFVKDNYTLFKFDIFAGGKNLFQQQLKKLIRGRIDAIHTLDEFTLMYEAKRSGLDKQVKILFLPEPPMPFYSTFCKNAKGKMLTEKFNAAFEEVGFTSEEYIELIQHEFDILHKK